MLDADTEGYFHLLLHLLLGLGHFLPGIHSWSRGLAALLFLSGQHLLSFAFSILHCFLLCQSLFFPLLSLLLLGLFFLCPLLLCQLLFLLCSDLLPLGLFVLESLEFFLLLCSFVPPPSWPF